MDNLFRALADRHRRHIVRALNDRDGPITTSALATDIVRKVDRMETDDQPDDPIDRLRTQLYHHHLPLLCEADLIEYDRDSRRVTPTELTRHSGAIIEIARSIEEVD